MRAPAWRVVVTVYLVVMTSFPSTGLCADIDTAKKPDSRMARDIPDGEGPGPGVSHTGPMPVINGNDGMVIPPWPNNVGASEKARLTLGYLAGSPVPIEGAAIELATRRFLQGNDSRSDMFDIRLIWRAGAEAPSTGVPSVLQLHQHMSVDVILGPLRSTVCIPAGFLISYWNLPFFPNGCTDPKLTDKSTYKTMIRVMPGYHKTGGAFVAIFQHYKWTIAYLISAAGLCDMGARGIQEAFKEHNITIAEWIRTATHTGDIEDELIDEYLNRAKERSRVIIMCQTKAVRMRIMYRAFELGMTNGDFVFFYYWLLPDGTTRQLWSDHLPSWEKGPLPVYTPEQTENLKKALYFLKLVTIANTLGPEVEAVELEQIDIFKEPQWNFTQSEIDGFSSVSEYTLLMFDATYLYLLSVEKAVADNKDHRNGSLLFNLAKRTTFKGATGKVVMDSNGDRDPEYWLWDYGPGMHQYEHVAQVSIVGQSLEKKLVVIKEPYWGNDGAKAPSSNPKCGFKGDLCHGHGLDQGSTAIIVVVVLIVVMLVASISVWCYRKRNKKWMVCVL